MPKRMPAATAMPTPINFACGLRVAPAPSEPAESSPLGFSFGGGPANNASAGAEPPPMLWNSALAQLLERVDEKEAELQLTAEQIAGKRHIALTIARPSDGDNVAVADELQQAPWPVAPWRVGRGAPSGRWPRPSTSRCEIVKCVP